jgi:hypothetical protein
MNIQITNELIEMLEKAFPDKLPRTKKTTLDDFKFLQGNQRVIDFLKLKKKEIEDNNLKGTLLKDVHALPKNT